MANNFTQFSFTIEATREQWEWLRDICAMCDGDREIAPKAPGAHAAEMLIDQCVAGDLSRWAQTIEYDGGEVWFHADECGDVQFVAELLASFLEAFDLDTILSFTWANTCSKMRLHEFDGGAVVITKTISHWLSPTLWIDDKIAEIRAARSVPAA